MIERIIIAIITKLVSWIYSKGLEKVQGAQDKAKADAEIEARLAALKAASKEAFNGEAITPEQTQKLKDSISNFIRNPSGSGGL